MTSRAFPISIDRFICFQINDLRGGWIAAMLTFGDASLSVADYSVVSGKISVEYRVVESPPPPARTFVIFSAASVPRACLLQLGFAMVMHACLQLPT
jgi:hypothetical protein